MGSARLRAVQIREALNLRGWDTAVRPHSREEKNAILIYIKGDAIEDMESARRRGNRVIVDLIDPHQRTFHQENADGTVRRLQPIEVDPSLFDGLIFVNQFVQKLFARKSLAIPHRVLLHPWDNRFGVPNVHHEFGLVSLGHSGDHVHLPELKMIELTHHVLTKNAIDDVKQFACHISIRSMDGIGSPEKFGDPAMRYHSKSNIKVSTAAACGANLISSRDPGATLVLPTEYPFWYDENKPLDEHVRQVRGEFGTAVWKQALEMMLGVRERTKTERVARDYEEFLREFC